MSFHSSLTPPDGGMGPLPINRAFVVDYLQVASRVPSQPLVRRMSLGEVGRVREQACVRIGWTAVFTRAYALLTERHPDLRLRVVEWPWLRLFRRPRQGATICVRREHLGLQWLFYYGIPQPEQCSLDEIQRELTHAATADVESIESFRSQIAYSRLPSPIRRLCWWAVLNSPKWLGKSMGGTVGITSVASWGAISVHPPSVGVMVLTYGPLEQDGTMQVTLVYDHRIFDGATIAMFLAELESILQTQIVGELRQLSQSRSAA